MPTRMIREGILSSERMARLGWAEEVFYRRLMSVVDDYGRFYAHHSLIRAACYPLQLDKVSDSDVGKWLTACVNAALVRVYPAQDGKRYLEIEDFGQRIQSKSKFPEPNSGPRGYTVDHGELPESTAVVGGVVEVVVEDEKTPRKRGSSRKTPLPDDFGLSDRVKRWAEERGHGQLDKHLEHFRLTAKAKGYTYADWDSALMKAVTDNWAKLQTAAPAQLAGGGRRAL